MKLNDTIQNAIDGAKAGLKKLLGQERVSQFANKDPNNKYACFFTSLFMYFRTRFKIRLTWEQYRDALKASGAITDKFYIKVEANKGDTRFAKAAGVAPLKYCSTNTKIREKILELLLKNETVPFALNGGEHFESVDGYEVADTGAILFHVDDPGGQGDTFADGDTLEVFRLEKGVRKYSRANDGKSKRRITRVYYFE